MWGTTDMNRMMETKQIGDIYLVLLLETRRTIRGSRRAADRAALRRGRLLLPGPIRDSRDASGTFDEAIGEFAIE